MAGFPQPTPDQRRHSHGLEQFFASLREPGRVVLDIGEFTQANVMHITGMGHRLYSEDLERTLDAVFGPGDAALQNDPGKTADFLAQILQFPPAHFDGVLVWDALERLSKPLLDVVMTRLYEVMRPGAALLACFHADSRQQPLPCYSFRIVDFRTMQLAPKGVRKPPVSFNNRAIEKLFNRFESVKFFLTRDNVREVIVRR
jgi:hypothetical protein